MSFVSFEFILFAFTVIPLYFLLKDRNRLWLLLVSSLFFYAYGNHAYVIILLLTTLFDYWAAQRIEKNLGKKNARSYLILSLLINFGILFVLKYFNFFNSSLGNVANALGLPYNINHINVILPIGISFYTFQEVAYIIDVYRGRLPAAKRFDLFTTFVVFFPQLVAGPIERATNLLPQFTMSFQWDRSRAVEGLRLILWGFFKKVVIADRLAAYVNIVYDQPQDHNGIAMLFATFFFAFQIYCDFSGYSDIAIGLAKILGFTLMQNFRQPYFSASIREFWARWHISLSTWFRDYLYIPLGGNRVPFARNLLNLFIVFLVSGLWHGANWTFIVWGALHGLYIVIETVVNKRREPSQRRSHFYFVRVLFTFLLVVIAWVFFRANSLDDAVYILSHSIDISNFSLSGILLFGSNDPGLTLIIDVFNLSFSKRTVQFIAFAVPFVLIGLLLLYDYVDGRWGMNVVLNRTPALLRWLYYYGVAAAVLIIGYWGLQSFIYFQF